MNKKQKKILRENILFIPSVIDREFTLSFLLEAFVEYVKLNEEVPTKILLMPEHFIKLCYFTDQFTDSPKFMGKDVELVYKEPEWHINL